jgi:signal transduction histidine kinase/CheY-like chemotaxis protein
MVDAAGTKRWLQIVMRPMLEVDGAISGVLGVATDVTARRQAEEERTALESTLRQSQRLESLGMLAGGVAHDFNNLLTPILGYASFALEGLPRAHPLAADLGAIKTAAERARDLTSQLLAFSRRQVLELQVVDLNREVEKSARMLQRVLPENIRFELSLHPDRPRVLADAAQLGQVFVNLAINARDAMPQGGVLRFATRSEGDEVVVRVTDTGVGMTHRVMSRIFEPFFTTKERGRGTGLGLSTVYGIVQQHEGAISVRSELGQGTEFEIRFPLSTAEEADTEPSRSGVALRQPGTGTVLVVEDDELVRDLVCEILADQGYTVVSAANGEEAVARASDQGVDLLLTDVILPGMDGERLTRRIAEIHPGVRAVWMSGYPVDALPGLALPPGAVFLRKPFSADDLGKRVREALHG